jgi:hypothetical protein
MKKNGYFIMEDGNKSTDIDVGKKRKRYSKSKPAKDEEP